MMDEAPATLQFERRRSSRSAIEGTASAFSLDADRFGAISELSLTDYSEGGLGAHSTEPLQPGEAVSLGFSLVGWPARRGIVQRCLPCGDGYRVAIPLSASDGCVASATAPRPFLHESKTQGPVALPSVKPLMLRVRRVH